MTRDVSGDLRVVVLDCSLAKSCEIPDWAAISVAPAAVKPSDLLAGTGLELIPNSRPEIRGRKADWSAFFLHPHKGDTPLAKAAQETFRRYREALFADFPLTKDLASGPGRTLIMGILNVTPDSFSDGGLYWARDAAVERGLILAREGADIIDVGGESTRPGAKAVSVEEELKRVLPVIEALAPQIGAAISIDTSKAEVAEGALQAGATMLNDVTGLTHDPRLAAVAAKAGASVVVMHMLGSPRTMQKNPVYDDLFADVIRALGESVNRAVDAGVPRNRVVVDPGLGFGKTLGHNLSLIRRLDRFLGLGCPVLLGPSRKSFLGDILDLPPDDRQEGTAAAVTAGILKGARIVRVHDVKEMGRVAAVADAIATPPKA
jgi:dihydropteroate synthase